MISRNGRRKVLPASGMSIHFLTPEALIARRCGGNAKRPTATGFYHRLSALLQVPQHLATTLSRWRASEADRPMSASLDAREGRHWHGRARPEQAALGRPNARGSALPPDIYAPRPLIRLRIEAATG